MSKQFRKIILAYDGSEGSDKALQLAASLAKDQQQTQLTVVNVYDEKIETRRVDLAGETPLSLQGYMIEGMPTPPAALGFNQTEPSTQALITNSVDQIFFEAQRQLGSVNTSFQVLEGDPADSICAYADEVNANLIIVGSSGKGGIKGFLLGNNTEKVARLAPCHVLIAK
ncbi:universal stress protein [Neobacillus notoginsengisoli]|uniref:Universal stress protein n=1 Tax=Neobacillus notoginsengisoli TaxID=1578198 RepID=A0A417YLL9_9BACI|nr:universal stress protein [Neobacillus notoginsengisoli]RHW34178.1 universal stress protein [Neobacillus notoginsengisoli]